MKTWSITFANGTCLEFHAGDVKPPPAVSFADNLGLLNEMWDDMPGHWGGRFALNIKGVPIPIVYWKEVYARSKSGGWKPNQWEQVKGSWFEWKVSLSTKIYETKVYLLTVLCTTYRLSLNVGDKAPRMIFGESSPLPLGSGWCTQPSLIALLRHEKKMTMRWRAAQNKSMVMSSQIFLVTKRMGRVCEGKGLWHCEAVSNAQKHHGWLHGYYRELNIVASFIF